MAAVAIPAAATEALLTANGIAAIAAVAVDTTAAAAVLLSLRRRRPRMPPLAPAAPGLLTDVEVLTQVDGWAVSCPCVHMCACVLCACVHARFAGFCGYAHLCWLMCHMLR